MLVLFGSLLVVIAVDISLSLSMYLFLENDVGSVSTFVVSPSTASERVASTAANGTSKYDSTPTR